MQITLLHHWGFTEVFGGNTRKTFRGKEGMHRRHHLALVLVHLYNMVSRRVGINQGWASDFQCAGQFTVQILQQFFDVFGF